MRKILLALALLWPANAWAQCTGVFPANTLCGNLSGSPQPPSPFSASGSVIGPGSSTSNGLAIWSNTTGTQLKDGSGQTIAGTYIWSGTQNFTGTFQINSNTMTFPGIATTIPGTGAANTWTALNNFTSTFQINGNTITWPAAAISVARIDAAQSLTGIQTFNTQITGPDSGIWTTTGISGAKQLTSSAQGGVGYQAGAGGTVTQITSRATGVTINKVTGQITMFGAAGTSAATTFTVSNSSVTSADTIILNQASGTNLYTLHVTAVSSGSFNITFFTTGGTATDSPAINFAVMKGSAS